VAFSVHFFCPNKAPGSKPLIQDLASAADFDHFADFSLNQFRAGDNGLDFPVGQIRPDGLFDAGEIQGLDFVQESPRNPPTFFQAAFFWIPRTPFSFISVLPAPFAFPPFARAS
jgi:hypothetical protein